MSSLLFFAKIPMNVVLFQPVHRLLAQHPELRITFTGKFRGGSDLDGLFSAFDLRGAATTPNWLARLRAYDVYVSPDFRLASKRSRVKVHMFHGFSIRNFAIHPRVKDFDKLFMLGPYMKRRFLESGILAQGDARIEEVGMPKLDPLVRGEFDRARVLESLRLDPARKTVLFAPTWIQGGCLDVQGEEIIRALARLPVNVIVKLHDNSFDLRKQRVDFGAALPPLFGPHMRMATGFDSNPYLAAADLLISDASSVANEYLVLDRPLVFFRCPELEKDWPSTDRETWGTKTGTTIERPAELERAILENLDAPNALSAVRRAAATDFFYEPGTAAERAAQRLLAYARE